MSEFRNKILEHLITKRKYNKLQNKYDTLKELYEEKSIELKVERNIAKKRQKIWENRLKEQEQEIISLKRKKSNDSNNKKKKSKNNKDI